MKNFRNLLELVLAAFDFLGRVRSSSPSLLAGRRKRTAPPPSPSPTFLHPLLRRPSAGPKRSFSGGTRGGRTWVWIPIPNLQSATEWNPTDTRSIQRS